MNVNFTIVDSANNTINLLNTPLSTTNANLFGTKLMSILFTKEEMAAGFVEGDGKSGFRNLDKKKIDLGPIGTGKNGLAKFFVFAKIFVKICKQMCIR